MPRDARLGWRSRQCRRVADKTDC